MGYSESCTCKPSSFDIITVIDFPYKATNLIKHPRMSISDPSNYQVLETSELFSELLISNSNWKYELQKSQN